eukprot:6601924-Pyramimonas_sp.AAC.1
MIVTSRPEALEVRKSMEEFRDMLNIIGHNASAHDVIKCSHVNSYICNGGTMTPEAVPRREPSDR